MNDPALPIAVLVLDADMTPALAVTRSLGRIGLVVDVAAHEQQTLARSSRYARRQLLYPDPLHAGDAFLEWMRVQLECGQYNLVIPVTERTATALIPLLDEPGYRELIALPDPAILQFALEKHRTLALAQELGITCPEGWLIANEKELNDLPAELHFPLVIKPARSIGNDGQQRRQLIVMYAQNHEELAAKVRQQLCFGSVLVQEYIQGDSVGIELIAANGEIKLAFQHKRLHEVPLTGGGSSLRESVEINPVLLEASRNLMRAMRWHGVAMVEFKHNPETGSYALMEVNGRFWGSLPLCIAAGADFPALLYELLVEGVIHSTPKVKKGTIARKLSADAYWYELVLRQQGEPGIVEFPSRQQMLKDLLLVFSPRHHFDVQQWRDLRPGLIDIGQILHEQWQRLLDVAKLQRLRAQQRKAWQQLLGGRGLDRVKQVLFVCHGNINRSAIAQKLLEQNLASGRVKILSAGFHEQQGRPADPEMCAIAEQHGLDLTAWQSSQVNRDMVEGSDLVLVMEFAQLERLQKMFPEAEQRIMLLGMVPGCAIAEDQIADPFGQSRSRYQQCFQQVRRCVERLAEHLPGSGERAA